MKTTLTIRLTQGLKDKLSEYERYQGDVSQAARSFLLLGMAITQGWSIDEMKQLFGRARAAELLEVHRQTMRENPEDFPQEVPEKYDLGSMHLYRDPDYKP